MSETTKRWIVTSVVEVVGLVCMCAKPLPEIVIPTLLIMVLMIFITVGYDA